MIRLTPELWLHSAFDGDTDAAETRELDLNLARRSGIVINRIVGQLNVGPDTTTGFDIIRAMVQEVDVDPDNVAIEFAGVMLPDGVVADSSRCFRQVYGPAAWDTAAGPVNNPTTILVKDWSHMPMTERPISITSLRHHVEAVATISNIFHAEVNIDYIIVELSLEELGIINASRR